MKPFPVWIEQIQEADKLADAETTIHAVAAHPNGDTNNIMMNNDACSKFRLTLYNEMNVIFIEILITKLNKNCR